MIPELFKFAVYKARNVFELNRGVERSRRYVSFEEICLNPIGRSHRFGAHTVCRGFAVLPRLSRVVMPNIKSSVLVRRRSGRTASFTRHLVPPPRLMVVAFNSIAVLCIFYSNWAVPRPLTSYGEHVPLGICKMEYPGCLRSIFRNRPPWRIFD